MSLRKLANGSVQQCFDVTRAEKGIGLVTVGTLRFNLFFEEVYDFKLDFIEWACRDIYPADEGGTSDPYIQFSIKSDWTKFFVGKGGYIGRSCRSEVEFNTLFPKYPEMQGGEPLYYNGTW